MIAIRVRGRDQTFNDPIPLLSSGELHIARCRKRYREAAEARARRVGMQAAIREVTLVVDLERQTLLADRHDARVVSASCANDAERLDAYVVSSSQLARTPISSGEHFTRRADPSRGLRMFRGVSP